MSAHELQPTTLRWAGGRRPESTSRRPCSSQARSCRCWPPPVLPEPAIAPHSPGAMPPTRARVRDDGASGGSAHDLSRGSRIAFLHRLGPRLPTIRGEPPAGSWLHQPAVQALVQELYSASADYKPTATPEAKRTKPKHSTAVLSVSLTLEYDALDIRSAPGQQLITYGAPVESASADNVRLLGTVAATLQVSTPDS